MATFAAFGSLAMLLFVAFGARCAGTSGRAGLADPPVPSSSASAPWRRARRGWRRPSRCSPSASPSCSPASSVRCWPARRPRCCSASSCRSRWPGLPAPSRPARRLAAGRSASLIAIVVLWPAPASDPLRMPLVRRLRPARVGDARRSRSRARRFRDRPRGRRRRGRRDRRGVPQLAHAVFRHPLPSHRPDHGRPNRRPIGGRARMAYTILAGCPRVSRRARLHARSAGSSGGRGGAGTWRRGAGRAARADGRDRIVPAPPARGPRRHGQAARSTISAGREPAGRVDLPRRATPPVRPRPTTLSSLEPTFRAQELSFAISAVGANIELAVAARERTWWQQRPGPPAPRGPRRASSAQERARPSAERHSVWLHNSVRAIALGVAVLSLTAPVCSTRSGSLSGSCRCCVRTRSAPARTRFARSGATSPGSSSGVRSSSLSARATPCCGSCFRWRSCWPACACRHFLRRRAGRLHDHVGDPVQHHRASAEASGSSGSRTSRSGGPVSLVVGVLFWPRGAGCARPGDG